MTPINPPGPRTIADLVLDDQTADSERPIVDGTSPTPLPDSLSAAGRAWVRRQVIERLQELLGREDLAESLVNAWSTGGRIAEAARETADDPAAERLVEVAEQQTTVEQDLTISIVYDETWSTDLQGKVTVTFDVGRIEAILRGGYLTRVDFGHCRVTGALELEGNLIASRPASLPVDIEFELREPINLARRSDTPALAATGP